MTSQLPLRTTRVKNDCVTKKTENKWMDLFSFSQQDFQQQKLAVVKLPIAIALPRGRSNSIN